MNEEIRLKGKTIFITGASRDDWFEGITPEDRDAKAKALAAANAPAVATDANATCGKVNSPNGH